MWFFKELCNFERQFRRRNHITHSHRIAKSLFIFFTTYIVKLVELQATTESSKLDKKKLTMISRYFADLLSDNKSNL